MKIYLVQGHTGEYDSYQEWNVCAYKTENGAKNRINELHNLMKEVCCDWSDLFMAGRAVVVDKMRNHENGDPAFESFYGHTGYRYTELELIE